MSSYMASADFICQYRTLIRLTSVPILIRLVFLLSSRRTCSTTLATIAYCGVDFLFFFAVTSAFAIGVISRLRGRSRRFSACRGRRHAAPFRELARTALAQCQCNFQGSRTPRRRCARSHTRSLRVNKTHGAPAM